MFLQETKAKEQKEDTQQFQRFIWFWTVWKYLQKWPEIHCNIYIRQTTLLYDYKNRVRTTQSVLVDLCLYTDVDLRFIHILVTRKGGGAYVPSARTSINAVVYDALVHSLSHAPPVQNKACNRLYWNWCKGGTSLKREWNDQADRVFVTKSNNVYDVLPHFTLTCPFFQNTATTSIAILLVSLRTCEVITI